MPGKRGEVQGWSAQATRNNLKFLRSVTLSELSGQGFAFTLTLRDCPPSHDDWTRLRRALEHRFRRQSALRIHWVTEWQRRKVPHLHGCVYFEGAESLKDRRGFRKWLTSTWCSLAWEYSAAPHCQYISPINEALGWLQYVAKHAARGQQHYQRSGESIPEGWKKTGRMWGKCGEWPTREGIQLHLSNPGFFAFRRIVQKWRYADARAKNDRSRMIQARTMLRGSKREISEVRGVSEWISEDTTMHIVEHLAARGFSVEC